MGGAARNGYHPAIPIIPNGAGQQMGWFGAFMQYSIYAALVLCALGLVASIWWFIVLEQRWQARDERDALELAERRFEKAQAARAEDGLPQHPWEEIRNRIGEMQVVADEPDYPEHGAPLGKLL